MYAVCSEQCARAVSYITCTTNAHSDRVMSWMTLQLEGVGAEEEGGQEGTGGWSAPGRAAQRPIAGQLGERPGLLLPPARGRGAGGDEEMKKPPLSQEGVREARRGRGQGRQQAGGQGGDESTADFGAEGGEVKWLREYSTVQYSTCGAGGLPGRGRAAPGDTWLLGSTARWTVCLGASGGAPYWQRPGC